MSWKGHVNILDADLASLPSCAFSAAALLTPQLPHLSHNCTAFPVTIRWHSHQTPMGDFSAHDPEAPGDCHRH